MLSNSYPGTVYLYRHSTDMRKSFDGLCGIVINELGRDPVQDGMFAFINKRRDRIKLLLWDRHGFWIFYKRLENGRIQLVPRHSNENVSAITSHELVMIIDGVDLSSIKRMKRFTIDT